MSASRIVLLRHGQTDFNLARRFQGRIDEPLNDSGRSQAAGAAGVLVSRLCEPSAEVGMVAAETSRSYDDGGVRIVCSPLVRALDTARILARVFDIAGYPCEGPVSDERLTERFYGTFEGKTTRRSPASNPRPTPSIETLVNVWVPRSSAPRSWGSASATPSSRQRPRAGRINLSSSSRTAPLSRGASPPCWDSIPRTSTACAASITATGRNWCPLVSQPRRAQRAPDGAWHRTTSGLARIYWGRNTPLGASFA